MLLTGDGWGCYVENTKESASPDRAFLRSSLHEETAGFVCLNRRYTQESVKKKVKEETDLPSAAALSAARRGETGCKAVQLLDIFIGRFPILAGGKSLGGAFFGGLSGTSCSGF